MEIKKKKCNKKQKKFLFSYRDEFEFVISAHSKEEALKKVYDGEIKKINILTEPHREFIEEV